MTLVERRAHNSLWVAKGYPDMIPGTGNPDPPPTGSLVYNATLIGQNANNYKSFSGQASYDAIEGDLRSSHGGLLYKGGMCSRIYLNDLSAANPWGGTSPLTWVRAGQPTVTSFHYADSISSATLKSQLRNYWDNKSTNPAVTGHDWLAPEHEIDVEFRSGAKSLSVWQNVCTWMKEVKNEAAYVNRTDISILPIFTGQPYYDSAPDDVGTYCDALITAGVFDAMGVDHYQTKWKRPPRYLTPKEYLADYKRHYDTHGLNFVMAEMGSPLPTQGNGTMTRTQLNNERATWTTGVITLARQYGFFEALLWWRRIALTGPTNLFSTIMFTPSVYDAQYDDDPTVAAWSQGVWDSQTTANTTLPWFSVT